MYCRRSTVSQVIVLLLVTLGFSGYGRTDDVRAYLQDPDAVELLKNKHGYLLIDLHVRGTAPSLKFVRLNTGSPRYLSSDPKPRKRSSGILLELKDKSDGFYMLSLPEGLYQITRINAPYFNLPFRLDTEYVSKWRFYIRSGKTNYVGKLVFEKERSTDTISVKLINRLAADKSRIDAALVKVSSEAPLVLGTGVRDDFYTFLMDAETE